MWFSSDQLGRALLLLTALGVAAYFAWDWLTGPPSLLSEMRRANPGWTIETPRHAGLVLGDGQGEPVFINADDAGPARLLRADCAQVMARLPGWLRLPPGRAGACLRIGDGESFVWVLNHHTPVSITELWAQGYAPLLDELKLAYWGGSSGRGSDGPASTTPGRGYRSMSYGIDPAPDRPQVQVNLMAFYLAAETVMVVTLRPVQAQAQASAPPR